MDIQRQEHDDDERLKNLRVKPVEFCAQKYERTKVGSNRRTKTATVNSKHSLKRAHEGHLLSNDSTYTLNVALGVVVVSP